MTRLERRYRALLGVLPRAYRAEREEEMVAVFLAGRPDSDLDGEYGWPGWAETGATLALAVRTRLGASVGLIGGLGLVLGVAMAATSAVGGGPQALWLPHLASVAALVAVARGMRVEAALLAALPVVAGIGLGFLADSRPALVAAFLLPSVITLAALCLDRPAGSRWLWAGAGASAVGALLPLVGLDPVTVAPVALAAAAVVLPLWTVAVSALALLPHAVLVVALPGGPPAWPLLGFAAVAVVLVARRAVQVTGARRAAG